MHMLGNVWEWTADVYVDNYKDAPINGNIAIGDDLNFFHVIRGGSWYLNEEDLRSANRGYGGVDHPGSGLLGLRLIRIPK